MTDRLNAPPLGLSPLEAELLTALNGLIEIGDADHEGATIGACWPDEFDAARAVAAKAEAQAADAATEAPADFSIDEIEPMAPSAFIDASTYWNAIQLRLGRQLPAAIVKARQLPVTATDWEGRPDDLSGTVARLYSQPLAEAGLEHPWRYINGTDRTPVVGKVCLCFADKKTALVPGESLIYVDASCHYRLVEARREDARQQPAR